MLEPVAVGTPLHEAPMQTTELLNVGQAGVSYIVEDDTVDAANAEQGYGVPVRYHRERLNSRSQNVCTMHST